MEWFTQGCGTKQGKAGSQRSLVFSVDTAILDYKVGRVGGRFALCGDQYLLRTYYVLGTVIDTSRY